MTEALTTNKKNHRSLPRKFKILLPLLLITIVVIGLKTRIWRSPSDQNFLELSGRIEGYETNVGAKVGGKIKFITVREGDRVRQGEIIAQLEDTELQETLNGAFARITAAEEQVNQALLQISVIENQIDETRLSQLQTEEDANGRINAAKASVASAQAQLAQALAQIKQLEAELILAKADRDRFAELFQEGAVPKQRFEQAQTEYDSLQESLKARIAFSSAAQEQVHIAQGNLTQSTASRLNSEIRLVQIQRLQTQLQQAQAQLKALQAQKRNAQANYKEIEARLQDLEIVSPIDGVVLTRNAEPGEVIAIGKNLLTIVNLGDVFLRGYIPEKQVGAITIGQPAQVFLDSAPDVAIEATVSAIDTEASFTPENIYFRDDRVTQVFGLKLSIDNSQGFAKPGMPADAEIILNQLGE